MRHPAYKDHLDSNDRKEIGRRRTRSTNKHNHRPLDTGVKPVKSRLDGRYSPTDQTSCFGRQQQ